jgi:hypothetical protein
MSIIIHYAFFCKGFSSRIHYKKTHQNQMKNKLTMYKQQKQPFLHLRASGLKMGRVTKPKTNNNLYSVPRIIVLKI